MKKRQGILLTAFPFRYPTPSPNSHLVRIDSPQGKPKEQEKQKRLFFVPTPFHCLILPPRLTWMTYAVLQGNSAKGNCVTRPSSLLFLRLRLSIQPFIILENKYEYEYMDCINQHNKELLGITYGLCGASSPHSATSCLRRTTPASRSQTYQVKALAKGKRM